eukprot:gene23125-biopygen16318
MTFTSVLVRWRGLWSRRGCKSGKVAKKIGGFCSGGDRGNFAQAEIGGKQQRTRTGRGPDAGRTIEFGEPDADRTRAWPFLPVPKMISQPATGTPAGRAPPPSGPERCLKTGNQFFVTARQRSEDSSHDKEERGPCEVWPPPPEHPEVFRARGCGGAIVHTSSTARQIALSGHLAGTKAAIRKKCRWRDERECTIHNGRAKLGRTKEALDYVRPATNTNRPAPANGRIPGAFGPTGGFWGVGGQAARRGVAGGPFFPVRFSDHGVTPSSFWCQVYFPPCANGRGVQMIHRCS